MRTWQAHGGKLRQMRFSPDGRTLATTAGQSKFVWLWDATTGERLTKLDTEAFGRVQGLAFSPDGTFLAATSDNRTARVWRTGTPIEPADHLDTIQWYPHVIAFLPTDQVAVWTFAGLRVWNRPAGEVPTTPRRADRHVPVSGGNSHVNVLCVTPDGLRLLLVGTRVTVLSLPELSVLIHHTIPSTQAAYDAAVSPDGRWLVVAAGADNPVFDLHTGEWRAKPLYHKWGGRAVAFTADGRSVLTAGVDGLVRFWDTTTWTEARRFDFGIGKLRVAAISPDGTVAAAGSDTGQVVVWDVDD